MKTDKKELRLKNGWFCTLRGPELEDAEALLRFLKTSAAETEFLLRQPEEIQMDVEDERRFLQGVNQGAGSAMILAELPEGFAGSGSLFPVGESLKVRHRCTLGMAVSQKYWGLGLGSALLNRLLEQAKALGYEQAELEVAERNQRAIGMYKKFGFQSYGAQYRGMKQKDGTYDNLLLMAKLL